MGQFKIIYILLATGFFGAIFAFSDANLWLGSLIGLAIGYLLSYVDGLNNKINNLQKILTEQKIPTTEPVKTTLATPSTNVTHIISSAQPVTAPAIKQFTPTPTAADLWLEKTWQTIKDYFTTGNVVVKVGVIVLLFGIGFLLQYVANNGWLPLKLRLSAAFICSIILFGIGFWLREKRREYGLALQGGAIGIFYLLVYISFAIYHLLSPTLAFALAGIGSLFTICFAVGQNALTLAVLALLGGFLAPYFIANRELTAISFFSYYAIINSVVLAFAYFKPWRLLSVLGFWFTFIIGTLWGYYRYKPEYLVVTEIFLSLYFLIYFAITLLNAYRKPVQLKNPIDSTLIFGVPFLYFSLQEVLLNQSNYGLAICAGSLAVFYGLIAVSLFKVKQQISTMLAEIFMGISTVFFTVLIPYAFNIHFTITSWTLEAVLLIWLGIKQSRFFVQLFGIALLGGTSFLLLGRTLISQANDFITFNLFFAALTSFISSYLLHCFYQQQTKTRSDWRSLIAILFFGWAICAWILAGTLFINQHFANYTVLTHLLYFSISSLLAWQLQTILRWSWLRLPAYLLLAVIGIGLFNTWINITHAFANFAWIGWLLSFSSIYYMLFQNEKDPAEYLTALHISAALLLTWLLNLESHYFIKYILYLNYDYQMIGTVLSTIILAYCFSPQCNYWPVTRNTKTYPLYINSIFAVIITFKLLVINLSLTANFAPLPYLPFLNAVDLTILLGLLFITDWLKTIWQKNYIAKPYQLWLITALGLEYFIWFNCVLARSLHHWLHIPYNYGALYYSFIAQASYSVLWGLLAFTGMLIAKIKQSRLLWIFSAWLTGIVVLKLFIIDLSQSNTLERIASFVIVGVLLLIIGYFSPIPPKENNN